MQWPVVLGLGVASALATGLGALPFLFGRRLARRRMGDANALAAGLMLAASLQLALEAVRFDAAPDPLLRMLTGFAAGVGFILLVGRLLRGYEPHDVAGTTPEGMREMLLIMVVMTAHSLTEGIGIGVSFGGGEGLGVFIASAITLHNVPEGLAISLVMVSRGVGVGAAAGWSILSSLPQPLLAVPAFLFVLAFQPFLPIGLGFAAGAMTWMVAAELIPDALRDTTPLRTAIIVLASAAAMLAIASQVPH